MQKILEVVDPDLALTQILAITDISILSSSIRDYLVANLNALDKFEPDLRFVTSQAVDAISILSDALEKVSSASDSKDVLASIRKAQQNLASFQICCVQCKTKNIETMVEAELIKTAKGGYIKKGRCPMCGTKVVAMVGQWYLNKVGKIS